MCIYWRQGIQLWSKSNSNFYAWSMHFRLWNSASTLPLRRRLAVKYVNCLDAWKTSGVKKSNIGPAKKIALGFLNWKIGQKCASRFLYAAGVINWGHFFKELFIWCRILSMLRSLPRQSAKDSIYKLNDVITSLISVNMHWANCDFEYIVNSLDVALLDDK